VFDPPHEMAVIILPASTPSVFTNVAIGDPRIVCGATVPLPNWPYSFLPHPMTAILEVSVTAKQLDTTAATHKKVDIKNMLACITNFKSSSYIIFTDKQKGRFLTNSPNFL
jgi:hypothetical protein